MLTSAALLQAALQAAEKAYAPYSKFRVGAAVLLENGEVVTGCNIENAAYPLALCAERAALACTWNQNPEMPIRAIAVASPDAKNTLSPCGACRQVIAEASARQNTDIEVIISTPEGKIVTHKISELLPLAFNF